MWSGNFNKCSHFRNLELLFKISGWVSALWISLGILLAASSGADAADRSSGYHWPTDASHAITSSFGEYRPGHFHAGIDIKTWGRIGYKVFAVRSGYIWKVRVSPFGYGKVVYQVLDTGEIAVYAHLSRFMAPLERRVRQLQKRRQRYRVTLVFKPEQFRVRKGQVIAYTGDTGVGYPHLHFELRDAKNRPINPFLRGLRVSDHRAPDVKAVAATPLASWARVDGDAAPVIRWIESQNIGKSGRAITFDVWGPVALSLLASDRTDAVRNRVSVYKLRLYVDETLVYACRYDRFSYAQTGLIVLDRDYRLRVRTGDIYYRLYVLPGNVLPFRRAFGPGSGVLWAGTGVRPVTPSDPWLDRLSHATVLQPGLHRARIVAEDFEGNRTEVLVDLHVRPPKEQVALHFAEQATQATQSDAEGTDGRGRVLRLHLDRYETYARVVVTSDHKFHTTPTVTVRTHREKVLEAWLVNDTTAVAIWPFPNEEKVSAKILVKSGRVSKAQEVRLFRVASTTSKPAAVRLGAVEIAFPPAAAYRTVYASAVVDTSTNWYLQPPPVFSPVRIEPEDVPIRRSALLKFKMDRPVAVPRRSLAWYYKGTDRWAFVGRDYDSTRHVLRAEVRGLGTFAVVADTTPPEVKILAPRAGSKLTRRRPTIRVRLSDVLSGIGGEEDFEVYLDSHRLIPEWDPERNTLRCYPDAPLRTGLHSVHVVVRDRCGNEATDTVEFEILSGQRRRNPRVMPKHGQTTGTDRTTTSSP